MTLRLLLGLFLITLALPISAQNQPAPWYRVELIVFDNLAPQTKETWPDDPGMPITDEAVDLTNQLPRSVSANTIASDNTRELKHIANRLSTSSTYRPLLHLAWRQMAGTAIKPIRLATAPFEALVSREVKVLVQDQPPQSDPIIESIEAYNNVPRPTADIAEKTEIETTTKQIRNVDGTARLTVERYIDMTLDIVVTKQLNNSEPAQFNTWQSYRLQEHRRLKPKELNYFDHPMFGVILTVNPITTP